MKPPVHLLTLVLMGLSPSMAFSVQDADFELPMDRSAIDREDSNYRTSYAPILRPAQEAVVAVHSSTVIGMMRERGMNPKEEMRRRFYGLPDPDEGTPDPNARRFTEGVGSGVVISANGYIVTNNHVIESSDGDAADEILVQLNDGRELIATLVGRDPRSDLAVIKVDATALPYLEIADSDRMEVGDIVFAIGNPLGVGLTITQGIVSATGRDNLSILGDSGYESFIQTDASINPGNSGGALVDAYGRLVGINTAIMSRTGGSVGIGFAIPSTFARSIAISLIREGQVRRGILGVNISDLDLESAEAFNVPEGEGVLIQSLVDDLPAERAGLRQGDVIVTLNGTAVANVAQLRIGVASHPPGESVQLGIRREGALLEQEVVLADPDNPYGAGALSGQLLEGIEVALLDDATRQTFGLERSVEGLVVTQVDQLSPHAESFQRGVVIIEINQMRPKSVDQARKLIESQRISRLFIMLNGRTGYLPLKVD